MILTTETNWYDTATATATATGVTTDPLWKVSCDAWDTNRMVNEISSNFKKILKEELKNTKGTTDKNMENTNNKTDKDKKFDPFEIVDYKVINDTVVIVTFADNTTEKAVCNKNDTYDFERAIEICICKKKFGGTKAYNSAIKNALRQVKAVDDKRKKEAEEKELEKRREAKIAKRKAKRKAQRRQQRIDDMSEAFLKAMLDYDDKILEMDDDRNPVNEDVESMPENLQSN